MKDFPRRRVIKVNCDRCGLLRIVSGEMTRQEVKEIERKYTCTDCTDPKEK